MIDYPDTVAGAGEKLTKSSCFATYVCLFWLFILEFCPSGYCILRAGLNLKTILWRQMFYFSHIGNMVQKQVLLPGNKKIFLPQATMATFFKICCFPRDGYEMCKELLIINVHSH